MGGLSFPSLHALSLPCFLSSTTSAKHLVTQVLGERNAPIESSTNALSEWEERVGCPPLSEPASRFQRKWFAMFSQVQLQQLRIPLNEDEHALRLTCLSSAECGAFLQGAPSNKFHTKLDDAAFQCSLRLRLGQPVAAESLSLRPTP